MTAADDAAALVASAPCNTVLPAGAGKTELLAYAVALLTERRQRTLFLTHTNAGLDAFRRRLRRLNVSINAVHTSTISAFCEGWCRSYPALAGVQLEEIDAQGFRTFHASAASVLAAPPIQAVLAATWDMALVDEYQDCQLDQHAAVLALAEAVPTVVVGDPLQAVFNFANQPTVGWEEVDERFARLVLPSVGHRWLHVNPVLGDDLLAIRELLERGAAVDLTNFASIGWVHVTNYNRIPESKRVADLDGTSVVISKRRNQCVRLAKSADGKLEALEDLAATDLFKVVGKLDDASPSDRLAMIGKFADDCLAKLPSGFKQRLQKVVSGETPTFQATSVLGPLTATALEARTNSSASTLRAVVREISAFSGLVVARRELWVDFDLVLSTACNAPGVTFAEAAERLRASRRHGRTRPLDRVAGTPLLVKGLEYDNALVVDAHQLSREELYVALTRGRRTVAVLAEAPTLGPWV